MHYDTDTARDALEAQFADSLEDFDYALPCTDAPLCQSAGALLHGRAGSVAARHVLLALLSAAEGGANAEALARRAIYALQTQYVDTYIRTLV